MVFRNKDPCQPCRAKKIPSPAPAVSPKATLTPRKTRQAMGDPSTVNLGNIPVFEGQEGLDALATISSNSLGARDNTPDLLETCNTKPVVIPRKRALFRESPPAKLTKKQKKLDGSPTDTFEAEIKVSVPAWITEKLKTIPDFRNPMGSKRSGLKYYRKLPKSLFANTCDQEDSSNSSVQSASTGESEKEEHSMPFKASLDVSTSKAESSGATTSIMVIDDDNPFHTISEDSEQDLGIKGDMGALSLMNPPAPALILDSLAKPEVCNPVEVENHYPLSVQALGEEPEKSIEFGRADSGMIQEVGGKFHESHPKEAGTLSNGKNLEEKVNLPVEIEPHQSETTRAVENAPYGCKPLSANEPVLMVDDAVDGIFSAEGNDSENVPVVTGLNEQAIENQEEEQCVTSNLNGTSSQGPGLQSITTPNGIIDGDVKLVPHFGNTNYSPLDKAGSCQKNVLKDMAQKDLVEFTREESAQATLNIQPNMDVQQGPNKSLDPDANLYLPDLAFPRYKLPKSPTHPNGVALRPGLTPWDRTPSGESLGSSEGSIDSENTEQRPWKKQQPGGPALPTIDRSRWRDLNAGPSRFSGPRIITPLRATPIEPGMGLVDTRRYSQHEGLWNMVTNDYLAKFKRVSKEKEEEKL